MKNTALLLITLLSTVQGMEPTIVVDNQPERGIPLEAQTQQRENGRIHSTSFFEMTNGTIKTVRIRYFNKETWANEEQACEYVRGYLMQKPQDAYGHEPWSQLVDGVPEIECIVEFTDEHKKKRLEERKGSRDGRLLIWHTESCYRDASGTWWFVSAFDQFHAAHPKGNRELARKKNK